MYNKLKKSAAIKQDDSTCTKIKLYTRMYRERFFFKKKIQKSKKTRDKELELVKKINNIHTRISKK